MNFCVYSRLCVFHLIRCQLNSFTFLVVHLYTECIPKSLNSRVYLVQPSHNHLFHYILPSYFVFLLSFYQLLPKDLFHQHNWECSKSQCLLNLDQMQDPISYRRTKTISYNYKQQFYCSITTKYLGHICKWGLYVDTGIRANNPHTGCCNLISILYCGNSTKQRRGRMDVPCTSNTLA